MKKNLTTLFTFAICWFFIQTPTYSQDVPLTVVNTFYGNYDQNMHGITFYQDITNNSFDIDLPTCTSGSAATIVNAYFIWQQRFRTSSNDLGTVPTFDNTLDITVGSNSQFGITADNEYTAINPSPTFTGSAQRNLYLYTGYADVTTQMQFQMVAGTNTINIDGFISPPESGTIGENWGAGLIIIYECPEYPLVTIETSAGSDFFYCGSSGADNGVAGDYSHMNCFQFPSTTTSVITADLEGMFGGSNNGTAPFRGGNICYATGAGSPPTNSGSNVAPSGDIVNNPDGCSDNPTWVASLGTEWDEFYEPLTIPAGTDWVCIQSHSWEDIDTDNCGSFAAATYVIKYAGNPYGIAPPCTTPAAPAISVTDNLCPNTTGTFNIDTPCTVGSSIEYSTDGGVTWTTTQPTYGTSSITVLSRCVDDTDPTCFSTSDSDTTNPNACNNPIDPCNNPNCTQPNEYFVCSNGSDTIDLDVDGTALNWEWFDGDGNSLGTNPTLSITNANIGNGTAGESLCFYYTAENASNCTGYTCCPVIITVEDCCPTNNCLEIQVIEN